MLIKVLQCKQCKKDMSTVFVGINGRYLTKDYCPECKTVRLTKDDVEYLTEEGKDGR